MHVGTVPEESREKIFEKSSCRIRHEGAFYLCQTKNQHDKLMWTTNENTVWACENSLMNPIPVIRAGVRAYYKIDCTSPFHYEVTSDSGYIGWRATLSAAIDFLDKTMDSEAAFQKAHDI